MNFWTKAFLYLIHSKAFQIASLSWGKVRKLMDPLKKKKNKKEKERKDKIYNNNFFDKAICFIQISWNSYAPLALLVESHISQLHFFAED